MKTSGDLVIARDLVMGVVAGSDQDGKVEHTVDRCHPERVGADAGAPNTSVFRVVGWSDATASRRTPTKTIPELAASGSSHKILKDVFVAACQTIRAMLCEIFDESAYDRFLLRTHASRSVASYRAFMRERDAAIQKKPRCC